MRFAEALAKMGAEVGFGPDWIECRLGCADKLHALDMDPIKVEAQIMGNEQMVGGVVSADKKVAMVVAELGTKPSPAADATPAALKVKLESEIARWQPVIEKAGVYAD